MYDKMPLEQRLQRMGRILDNIIGRYIRRERFSSIDKFMIFSYFAYEATGIINDIWGWQRRNNNYQWRGFYG